MKTFNQGCREGRNEDGNMRGREASAAWMDSITDKTKEDVGVIRTHFSIMPSYRDRMREGEREGGKTHNVRRRG